MGEFHATCNRGHERLYFGEIDGQELCDGGREGFERHMISVHGAKRKRTGGPDPMHGAHRTAPGWSTSGKFEPYPWKPAKRDADGGAKRLDKWVSTRELVIEEVGDDETARAS
jgi:hypothetical protein